MDPLQTFAELYGTVPTWVQTLHEFAPDVLAHYTSLRTAVMQDGALPRKDKELILVGINAARRYETSMLYHTQGALDAGASVLEIADAVLCTVISRGLPAWLEGQKAVRFALEHQAATTAATPSVAPQQTLLQDTAACDAYYTRTFGQLPAWAALMRDTSEDVYISYTNLRNASLAETHIRPALKELILAGINAAERYPEGVRIHASGALAKGATKAQLAECFTTALLTAGIPAWFLGTDFLASVQE
jgi:alkylhydroperoxidase/carboxymuconolactone decarboxylase family protein YurZ